MIFLLVVLTGVFGRIAAIRSAAKALVTSCLHSGPIDAIGRNGRDFRAIRERAHGFIRFAGTRGPEDGAGYGRRRGMAGRFLHQFVASALFACLSSFAGSTFALADAAAAPNSPPATGLPTPSIATSLPILADPAGVRSALAAKGVTWQINDNLDLLGDVSGGMRRGSIAENQVQMVVDADLEKLFGWSGGAVHASGYRIDGTNGLSRGYVGNLLTVSNIEALSSTKLYELWFEQTFAAGKAALRFGQLGADTEFVVSKYAGLFVSSTFGFPGIFASDLPSGGPAYPLAAPGARLKLTPTEHFTFLLGVFDGNAAGPGVGNPQILDRNGVNFRLQDPPLAIAEGQYAYTIGDGTGLDGSVKVGAYDHFGAFNSNLLDTRGNLLASPSSNGTPQKLSGNDGVYAVVDQMIYHPEKSDPGTGVGLFARIAGSPQDRNLIDFYVDGGVNVNGLVAGRPNDSFGVAFSYAHVSHSVSLFEQQLNAFTGVAAPIQNYEAALEATYQFQVAPGFTIQPDLQYIVHPGGNIANPFGIGLAAIPNAVVVGVRATINY